MKVIFRSWEIPDIEPLEYEDSEQFIGFLEEEKPYSGIRKEDINIAFIDGVRRTELACYVDDGEQNYREGVFASIGVGGLLIKLGKMNLLPQSIFSTRVERFLVVRGKPNLQESLQVHGLKFSLRYATKGELTTKVNEIMREELESSVAKEAYENLKADLVICDGPLSYNLRNTDCVGYIKNIKRLYVRQDDIYLLKELRKGQRTPIIKVGHGKGDVDKYTWYVKLSDDGEINSLARLEMFSHVDEAKVIHIADLTAGMLPMFASKSYTDRRAPHNLVPIKSLEDALRASLGHYSIVRHQILSFFNA